VLLPHPDDGEADDGHVSRGGSMWRNGASPITGVIPLYALRGHLRHPKAYDVASRLATGASLGYDANDEAQMAELATLGGLRR
jgi:thiamine biosynthesis protein ThiC